MMPDPATHLPVPSIPLMAQGSGGPGWHAPVGGRIPLPVSYPLRFLAGAITNWLRILPRAVLLSTGAACLASAPLAPARAATACAVLTLGRDGTLGCEQVAREAAVASASTAPERLFATGIETGPALDVVGDPVRARLVALGASFRPGRGGPAALAGHFTSPLNAYSLTSTFGGRMHPVLGIYRMHNGVDMAAPLGTRVVAAAPGIVTRANWAGGYGLSVRIEHAGRVETQYGHLSAILVREGQTVRAGDPVGLVGSTGLSTGPHLHYEMKMNGAFTNPLRQR